MFILFPSTFHPLWLQLSFDVPPPIILVLVDDYGCPCLRVVQVFHVWLWMNFSPCDQQYPFGSSFDIYFFLLVSDFSWRVCVACPILLVPYCISLAMVAVIFFGIFQCFFWSNQLGNDILVWEIYKWQVVKCQGKILLFFFCMFGIMEAWLYNFQTLLLW